MKMRQKGVAAVVIAVVVIIVVAAAAAGAYFLTQGEGEGEGEGEGLTLSSVDFTFSGSNVGGYTGAIRCRGRNLQTDNPDIRIEETTGEHIIIINNTAGEYYTYESDVWTKYTGTLAEQYFQTMSTVYGAWETAVVAWIQNLGTADFTTTYEEVTVSITSISANPTLGDDVFAPPTDATIEEYSL